MKKYLYLILLFSTMSLTGCGTKDVVYDIEKSAEDNTAGEETETKETKPKADSGDTLVKTLGISDIRWKETIGSGANSVFINANAEVPDVSAMYTLEVSEHYYTSEEQQKIAEYFLDADTIQVNKDKIVAKEWLQRRLDYYNIRIRNIEAEEERDEPLSFGDEVRAIWSNEKKMLSNEINRLTNLMNEAPAVSDVSTVVQDYSENYYIGSKGDVVYTLSFDVDEDSNTSSWSLEAVDGNDFSHKKIIETKDWWRYADVYHQGDNLCEMTEEEACAKAEKICKDLGISGMKVAAVCDLWLRLQYDPSADYEEYEEHYNGYSITLVRNINGVAVDSVTYSSEEVYLDTEATEKSYDKEKVVVELNDMGIMSVTYEGCVTATEVGNAVKLLSYDQIQEIFRKELNSMRAEEKIKMGYLRLGYTRVADEAAPNQYCYIPAWCLSSDNPNEVLGHGINPNETSVNGIDKSGVLTTIAAERAVWINAIDGSRIDPYKAGFIYYTTPEKYLEEHSEFYEDEDAVEEYMLWKDKVDDDFWEEEERAKERRQNTLFKLPERE